MRTAYAVALSIVLAVLAFSSSASLADVTAGQYGGGGTLATYSNSTGFRFTVATSLTVTELGVWDENGDGLTDVHNVGIFRRSDLGAIATAVVPAGTAAALIDGSRFVPISQVTLQPGVEYYMLSDNFATDRFAYGSSASVFYAAQVNWLGFTDGTSNSIFASPAFNSGFPGNLGPNFRFAVPAPSGVSMLGLAWVLVGRRRR